MDEFIPCFIICKISKNYLILQKLSTLNFMVKFVKKIICLYFARRVFGHCSHALGLLHRPEPGVEIS